MTESEITALGYLPNRLADAVKKTAGHDGMINEIRLRAGKCFSIVSGGHNLPCGIDCTKDEVDFTVDKLCRGSLYSHSEDIKNGVITTESGIRAGVSGRGIITGGQLECVRDITSVSIRISHRIAGAADFMLPLINKYGGILVYSKPAGGKTTVLRELIPLLSEKYRVSVIDTRYELSCGIDDSGMTDVFLGYPRYEGMMAAVKTMSPEFIVCDEISTSADAEAVMYAHSSGVTVIASAHAGNVRELYKNKSILKLTEAGVFGCFCGLNGFGEAPAITVSAGYLE